jgi:phosphatidylcholine synthase
MMGSHPELGLTSVEQDEGLADRRALALRFAAWGVHLYTAIGLILAARMAVLLVRGGAEAFREAFVLMLVASLVDATDGTLARKVRVKAVLPEFDGRKLDDIIDFLTWTFLPLLLIWRAGLFPDGAEPWLLVPLLASAYGFCQVEAKTDDGYFLGFPSLWNVVAFYLYVLHLPGWLAVGIVVVLGLMTFVPSRYLYPSTQPGLLNLASNLLAAPWCCLLLIVMGRLPSGASSVVDNLTWWLAAVSLYFPIFYMVASWTVTLKLRKVRRA